MSALEDFTAAAQGDAEATRRLRSYFGPFVHCALLAQVTIRASITAVPMVLDAAVPRGTFAEWTKALLDAARAEAARLATNPANTIEQADESAAGNEARRGLATLRPLATGPRELALLRLVQGIGAAELTEVLGENAMPAAAQEAMALLDPASAVPANEPYLLEPQSAPPFPALVAIENRLELLRYNEDLPAPVVKLPAAPVVQVDEQIRTQVVQGATDQTQQQLPKIAEPREVTITAPLGHALSQQTAQRLPPVIVSNWRTDMTRLLEPVRTLAPAKFPALWVAAVLAALAGALAYGAVQFSERAGKAGRTLVPVLVAATDLPAGTPLEDTCLSERLVPAELAGASAVKPEGIGQARGQRLRYSLQAGDPLLWTHFSGVANERLSERLSRRMHAYSLPVSRLSSNGGLLRPDDRIDILAFLEKGEAVASARVTTVLENVPVLAVGLVSARTVIFPQGRDPEYSHISVAVLAEEAELLALANELSAVRLTLRNPEDNDLSATRAPVVFHQLLDQVKAQKLQTRRMTTIQMIRESRPANR